MSCNHHEWGRRNRKSQLRPRWPLAPPMTAKVQGMVANVEFLYACISPGLPGNLRLFSASSFHHVSSFAHVCTLFRAMREIQKNRKRVYYGKLEPRLGCSLTEATAKLPPSLPAHRRGVDARTEHVAVGRRRLAKLDLLRIQLWDGREVPKKHRSKSVSSRGGGSPVSGYPTFSQRRSMGVQSRGFFRNEPGKEWSSVFLKSKFQAE